MRDTAGRAIAAGGKCAKQIPRCVPHHRCRRAAISDIRTIGAADAARWSRGCGRVAGGKRRRGDAGGEEVPVHHMLDLAHAHTKLHDLVPCTRRIRRGRRDQQPRRLGSATGRRRHEQQLVSWRWPAHRLDAGHHHHHADGVLGRRCGRRSAAAGHAGRPAPACEPSWACCCRWCAPAPERISEQCGAPRDTD